MGGPYNNRAVYHDPIQWLSESALAWCYLYTSCVIDRYWLVLVVVGTCGVTVAWLKVHGSFFAGFTVYNGLGYNGNSLYNGIYL